MISYRIIRINGGKQFLFCYRFKTKKPEIRSGGLAKKPDPHEITTDYIGPSDKISHLRPYVRHIPKDETPLERQLRELRIEVEKWNQEFWTRHNTKFQNEKEEFIRLHKEAGIKDISADKMSEFYKMFLDKSRRSHILYNLSWYIKNFQMLMLAFKVEIQKLFKRRKST